MKYNMYKPTLEDLKKMKDIEAVAYPSFMQSICDCDTLEELANYCECKVSQLFCIIGENYYLLAANKKHSVEIVDFASTGRCLEIFKIVKIILKEFSRKKVIMDCRESTSYPIVIKLLKRKKIKYTDTIWYWENEVMHEICFHIFY